MLEGRDISLVWSYTLDGTIGSAEFFNVTGGGNDEIGKRFSPGSITPRPNYQARFRAEVSNTQAQLRILAIQISDQGRYELDIAVTGLGGLTHVVEVIVQCKYLQATRKVVSVPRKFFITIALQDTVKDFCQGLLALVNYVSPVVLHVHGNTSTILEIRVFIIHKLILLH